MNKNISDEHIDCLITLVDKKIIIKGYLKNPSIYKKKIIKAPNPPNLLYSYSGSCLPYPCEEIALENTKNIKTINDDGIIDCVFSFPNSFYSIDGYTKIKSPIILYLDNNKYIYELFDLCPLKTIRDRVRGNPSFYAIKELILPVATAENNMYNYSHAKINYNIA